MAVNKRNTDLDVYRLGDGQFCEVCAQVLLQIIALDWSRIAKEPLDPALHQPRVMAMREVPQMVVRIGDLRGDVHARQLANWRRSAMSSQIVTSSAMRPLMIRQCVTPMMSPGLPVGAP